MYRRDIRERGKPEKNKEKEGRTEGIGGKVNGRSCKMFSKWQDGG